MNGVVKSCRLPAGIATVAMLLILLATTVTLGASAPVKDVPPDHWAYQAVITLVNKGYLGVNSDGTFKGTESVDRFTLASVVARVLQEIDQGGAGTTAEDVALLRKLSTEFRDELVKWYQARADLEKRMSAAEKSDQVLKDDVKRIKGELERQSGEYTSGLEGVSKEQKALRDEVRKIRTDLETTAAKTAALEKRLTETAGQLQADVQRLRADLGSLRDALTEKGVQIGDQSQVIAELRSQLAERAKELAAQALAIQKLQDATQVATGDLGGRTADLSRQTGDLLQQTASLQKQVTATDQKLAGTQNRLEEAHMAISLLQKSLEGKDLELASALSELDGRLKSQLALLGNDLKGLQEQVNAIKPAMELADKAISDRLGSQENAFAQVRATVANVEAQLRKEIGETATQQLAAATELMKTETAALKALMEKRDAQLEAEIAALRSELTGLKEKLGLSEDQIDKVNQQMRDDLATQISATLIREQRLETELKELRAEFNSYKEGTGKDIANLKSTNNVLMGVAILGLILSLVK